MNMETAAKLTPTFRKFGMASLSDGLEISVMTCVPQTAPGVSPKGIVQLVHGMCEHKERYIPFMEFLARNGYAGIIHDHRGHGESVRSREDLGYFYEGGFMAMIEDIKAVNSIAKENFPGLTLALFGHSMGSMAVRSYVKRYDDTVDTLIVCGSPSHNPGAGFAKFLTKAYSAVTGDRHRPSLIQHLAFGTFNRNFGKVTSPNAWVCSDPEIVRKYDSDPLCNFQFTNDGFINLFSLMQDAYDPGGWSRHREELPVRFISGAEDPCLVSEAAFRKAVNAMKRVGYQNVTSKLYPAMRHEILNETGKKPVWKDILDFLEENRKLRT